MQPSGNYVVPALGNMSVAAMQDDTQFVASKVFPVCNVPLQSAKYWTWPQGALLRNSARKRGAGQESAGSGFEYVLAGPYNCDLWALHVDIDRYQKQNVDAALDIDRDATTYLTHQLMLSREIEFCATFMATGQWSTDLTPSAGAWSAPGSAPIADLRAGMEAIKLKTGRKANTIVFPWSVWNVLQDHATLKGLIQFGTPGNPTIVTQQLVAALLGIENVYVAEGLVNSGAEGAADSIGYIAPKNVLITYTTGTVGQFSPTAGYTFGWNAFPGAGGNAQSVSKEPVPNTHSDRLEIEACYDMKIVAPDMGCVIAGAVA